MASGSAESTIWGDTSPHYWSALTGWAFYRYWQATGDESYQQRAKGILLGNLSAFSDGRTRSLRLSLSRYGQWQSRPLLGFIGK